MGFLKPVVKNNVFYQELLAPSNIEFPKEITVHNEQESMCTIPLEEYEQLKNELKAYRRNYQDLAEFVDRLKLRDLIPRIDLKSVTIDVNPEGFIRINAKRL